MRLALSGWSIAASVVLVSALAAGAAHAAPSAQATPETSKTQAHTHDASSSAKSKLDINTATKQELAKLPGIGEAYSEKILAGRPYKAKSDLLSKKILPQHVYDKIAPMVIAKQK